MTQLAQMYAHAMRVDSEAEADAHVAKIVALIAPVTAGKRDREDAYRALERMTRESIVCAAARHGDHVRARVERVFRCAHPVFGAIADVAPPTQAEAFELGKLNAERARYGKRPVITLLELRAHAQDELK